MFKFAHLLPTNHPYAVLKMQKVAGLAEDLFARAAYIEGLLGVGEHTLSRNPKSAFRTALNALVEQQSNDIVDALKDKNMSDDDIAKMVGMGDTRLRESMMYAAEKGVSASYHGSGSARVQAEEVVQSLSAGLNPVTGEFIPRFHKHSLFYYAGDKGQELSSLSLASIRSFISTVALNLTTEILKGSMNVDSVSKQKRMDERSQGGHSPSSQADSEGDSPIHQLPDRPSEINAGDVLAGILKNPSALQELDRAVSARLGGPAQKMVWQGILHNPDWIVFDDKGTVGVKQTLLQQYVTKQTGQFLEPAVVGRTFRMDVLPVMRRALANNSVMKKFMKDRDFRDTYHSDMMHMAKRIAARSMVAASVLKKDMKLKNGDVIPAGTPVQIKFLGHQDPKGYSICELVLVWVSPSGRNYQNEPMKTQIKNLPDFVRGIAAPSMGALERMVGAGIATTPTGKRVEPDGYGPDGSPSWLLVFGFI